MKKLAILLSLVVLSMSCVNAAETKTTPKNVKPVITQEQIQKMRVDRANAFDQKLGLTDEQKAKAKEFRTQAHEKMVPVMQKIKTNRLEAKKLKNIDKRTNAQEEKLTQLNNDFRALQKEIHQIRQQNMKDFESILTDDQKNTLKTMKKEGRNQYRKNHPPFKKHMQPRNVK
ncbi:MAG: Spy/CpxP family protein refolding chaperone [bacterium]|nr:Spy/CpxP family protein refolding chaperone [bacterium]